MTNVEKPVVLTFDDGWKNQYEYAYPLLKKYNMRATFYIYPKPIGAPAFLTWKEIKEMEYGGMIIGGHTFSHSLLKNLSDSNLRHEIIDSKTFLEKKLDIKINDFASPYGYSGDHIIKFIKEGGYRTARTLYKGVYHDDILNLKAYLISSNMQNFINILNK